MIPTIKLVLTSGCAIELEEFLAAFRMPGWAIAKVTLFTTLPNLMNASVMLTVWTQEPLI